MSILMAPNSKSYKASRQKKHSEHPGNEGNDKYQDITVVGYNCKLFRDDVMAKYIDDGKHLIPWMNDETLLVDRYDCRGHLYTQEEFAMKEDDKNEMTPEEQVVDTQCDRERYLGLQKDLTEEEFLEEEERKRFRSQYDPTYLYNNIGFQYNEVSTAKNSGDEEYDPSACYESEEDQHMERDASVMYQPSQSTSKSAKDSANSAPLRKNGTEDEQYGKYEKPENLELPEGIEVPDSQKAHSIVEKTALFISKQNIQMEIILKAKQSGNPQFDFLSYGNWLNPYYKLVLQKIRDGSYKLTLPEVSTEQSEGQSKTDSNSEESDDSDGDEYIHPLLQAHRRPIKTVAKPTPATPSITQSNLLSNRNETAAPRDATRGADVPQSSAAFTSQPRGNAAAVYMARKYQNSKQSGNNSPVSDTGHPEEGVEDGSWTDQWEEARAYPQDPRSFPYMAQGDSLVNQGPVHPSLAMIAHILPPPPPGQEDDTTRETYHALHTAHSLPPPPPPPGCSDSDIPGYSEQVSLFNQNTQKQQEQEQQQHIVPPPPDLKPVVDKLAEYVSRNGEEFEGEIKRKKDPRFEFLQAESIYFPYYLYRKQHFLLEIAKKKAEDKKEKKVSKPLSFALQTKKKAKTIVQKIKATDVFQKDEDSNSDNEEKSELDGYRPNKLKRGKTALEKSQIAMEQVKVLIAEAQQKQNELQGQPVNEALPKENNIAVEKDKQVQLERRRKAAAFIGKLKQSHPRNDSGSSSDDSSDTDTSDHGDSSDERESPAKPKRHFQEKLSENANDEISETIAKIPRIDSNS